MNPVHRVKKHSEQVCELLFREAHLFDNIHQGRLVDFCMKRHRRPPPIGMLKEGVVTLLPRRLNPTLCRALITSLPETTGSLLRFDNQFHQLAALLLRGLHVVLQNKFDGLLHVPDRLCLRLALAYRLG